jgi:hypothetical protein
MFLNLRIKQNLPSILTITLLVLTVGFLFLYGNSKIKKAENINLTVLAWENLSNNHNSSENLNLSLKNITDNKISYKIDWLLNEKTIDSQEIAISAQDKKIIPPTKKVANELATLLNASSIKEFSQDKFSKDTLYQIKITWDKHKTETLGKWLK